MGAPRQLPRARLPPRGWLLFLFSGYFLWLLFLFSGYFLWLLFLFSGAPPSLLFLFCFFSMLFFFLKKADPFILSPFSIASWGIVVCRFFQKWQKIAVSFLSLFFRQRFFFSLFLFPFRCPVLFFCFSFRCFLPFFCLAFNGSCFFRPPTPLFLLLFYAASFPSCLLFFSVFFSLLMFFFCFSFV